MFYEIVQFSRSVMSNSFRPHEPQHARLPCPSPTPGVHPNSCPLSRWCHLTISPSVVPFCLQSFPASGSFQMSQFFASDGQRIGVSASASVLPMNIQDWFSWGWTCWISLLSKGLSRVFSNIIVQKHQLYGSSQCTSPKHPVSCIEPGRAIRFIYDIIHVSMPFSQIIPSSSSPTQSKRLFYVWQKQYNIVK